MIENALDFLLRAAEEVREDDPRSLKYSLLHLVATLELVLKARLYREDWTLVFRYPANATHAALTGGNFRSADFDDAIDRLKDEASVSIDDQTLRHLRDLRNLRNQVQHFAINVERRTMISLLAKGCSFVVGFCNQELRQEMAENGQILEEIMEHLREFDHFVSERMTAIAPDLEDAVDRLDCPRCWQQALRIGDPPPNCAFCGYEIDAESLAEDVTQGGISPCPHCDVTACGIVIYNNDEAGWFCAACGQRGTDYSHCPRCDRLKEGDDVMCRYCWKELLEKD